MNNKNNINATQIDPGWRGNSANNARQTTAVDPGWRGNSANNARLATVVDPGWRKDVASILDPANVMNRATANYFSDIKEFKDAIEKLTSLKSSLGNVYQIKATLSKSGGESVVLLCAAPDGSNVVAKVYYEPVNGTASSISTRASVLDYMGTEEGQKYTLAVEEVGLVEFVNSKYYFETMPYCEKGDLTGKMFSFDEIVLLANHLNEALHSIHKAGIIHRDIKPENIFVINGQIKIGDFGIAKSVAKGRSNVTDHILGTEGYAAPETRRYIFSEKSDYYSLGVTLATLFEGHFVFENMNYEMQVLAQENESLPLLRVDANREQLENLFNGLCRINSKQRFGYEQVKRWLTNHNYTGGDMNEEWTKTFGMFDESYNDEKSMFFGFSKDIEHWEEAKSMLYRNIIGQFFGSFRPNLSSEAYNVAEVYRSEQDEDKGLAIFLKKLYAPGPIVWKGHTFNSLFELGAEMVATQNQTVYCELLQKHCISHWLRNTEGIVVENENLELVEAIEAFSATEPKTACYWFGNSFAPKKMLQICNKNVSNIEELVQAMFSSPNDFYQAGGYEKLFNRIEGADLYGLLFSLGYKEVVDKTWEHLNKCDSFNTAVVLISMMEKIAVKADVDPTIIRKFFVDYGPVGLATYTKKLASWKVDKVYVALDADGKHILANILGFQAPPLGPVDELFRKYIPLIEYVEKLRSNLIGNPHLILTGLYESKGVICTNLIGCFAFEIFGRVAPLGFNTWIELAAGGVEK